MELKVKITIPIGTEEPAYHHRDLKDSFMLRLRVRREDILESVV
jgi:hypothetical protein